MSTDKKIKLIGALIGIICFIALMAGITYAWITWRSSNVSISGNTDCFEIESATGESINNENILLFDEKSIINNGKITIKNGMAITNVTAYINSNCNTPAKIELMLNVTNLNEAFITGNSIGALKYVIASYDPNTYSNISVSALNGLEFDIVSKGSIINTGQKSILYDDLSTTEKGYLIIFYIDGYLASNDASGNNFNASVTGYATQYNRATLIDYITNLYVSGSPTLITQENSNASYYYSYQDDNKSWGLMNDGLKVSSNSSIGAVTITESAALTSGTEGNIRYFGKNVNNYIYFNCEEYPDTNCEKWRIIGIVDGKVKIVRNEAIGKLAWDKDINQDSSLTTHNNNWNDSSLQQLLNGLYYDRGTTSAYTYLSGPDGTIETNLNLKRIGITAATRNNNLISESTWYLGGYNNSQLYPNQIYKYERTNSKNTVNSNNPYTKDAMVGLMYPSDYGYGADLTICSSDLYNYESSMCKDTNWFYSREGHLLITPNPYDRSRSWHVRDWGNSVYEGGAVYTDIDVRPTVYLDREISTIIEGTDQGSITNPYRIYESKPKSESQS